MAPAGDYYVVQYKGHTVELIRNHGDRTLKLVIDGTVVANESCLPPGRLAPAGGPVRNAGRPAVAAKSAIRRCGPR